jgi:putative oxidoreductase
MREESVSFLDIWTPRILSVLRIITAFMFIAHGTQKVFNAPPSTMVGSSIPPLLMSFGGLLELVGGALLFIGIFTRPVAFILCGEMAVAYFMVSAPKAFLPLVNQGELAVLYCFVFLFFSFAGGGEWSIDRLWRRSNSQA